MNLLKILSLLFGTIAAAVPLTSLANEKANVHVSGGVSPNNMLFRIGIEQGFYRDENIETQPIQAGTLIGIQGLVAGSFDFSQIVGQSGTAILRGAPLKVVMAFDARPVAWIYGSKRIKSIAELKGKSVGVSAFGSGFDQMTRTILQKNGLDPQKDVNIRALGADPERLAGLANGVVDAVIFSTLGMVQAKKAGFNQLVFVGDEVESVSVGVVASDKSLSDRTDYVRRFLRGTLRAFRWFKNNEKAAVARLARGMKVAEEDALDVYKATLKVYSSDGTVSRSAQEDMIAFWKRGLKIEKDFPAEAVFDFRVINALNRELGK